MVRARRARKWTRKCVRDRSGEAALENGTQKPKISFFCGEAAHDHRPRSGWDDYRDGLMKVRVNKTKIMINNRRRIYNLLCPWMPLLLQLSPTRMGGVS